MLLIVLAAATIKKKNNKKSKKEQRHWGCLNHRDPYRGSGRGVRGPYDQQQGPNKAYFSEV